MAGTEDLAKTIEELCPRRDGSYATEIEGLFLTRCSTTRMPRASLNKAVFCVVAQGAKCTLMNQTRLVYDPNSYLLVSLDLPLVGQIVKASPAEPFLGLSLVLDFDEIGCLVREADLLCESVLPSKPGLAVALMDDDLLDAVIRLAKLLKKPARIPVLAPLVRREILYRLLLGEEGGLLRRMASESGKVQRVAHGIAWLRQDLTRPVRMEDLAREMGMSPSAMRSWFRAVTSMSPLQYRKQMQLQEARRMLLSETLDAGAVSRCVGYESASQFSREYRRFFGAPPMQDVERVRAALAGGLPLQRSDTGGGRRLDRTLQKGGRGASI